MCVRTRFASLKKSSSFAIQDTTEFFEKAIRKFADQVQIWTAYASFLFRHDQAAKGYELLKRATRTLPKNSRESGEGKKEEAA